MTTRSKTIAAGMLLLVSTGVGTRAAAASVPEGAAPVVTAVEPIYVAGGLHSEVHVDWGVHTDAPVGIIEYLTDMISAEPASIVIDYSDNDPARTSYRAIACYANCTREQIAAGDASVSIGQWHRPDYSAVLAGPPPEVRAWWEPHDFGVFLGLETGSHAGAEVVTYYRNGTFLGTWELGADVHDNEYGSGTTEYAARACYSDCWSGAISNGFAQQTEPGVLGVPEAEQPWDSHMWFSCWPRTVSEGESVGCMALLEPAEKFWTPAMGRVTFASDEPLTFSPAECTLESPWWDPPNSYCNVEFTVTGPGGEFVITASYLGDGQHSPVSAQATIEVLEVEPPPPPPGPTSTDVACMSTEVLAGASTMCTATVLDAEDASPVAGNVRLSTGSGGSVPTTCALNSAGRCQFSFSSAPRYDSQADSFLGIGAYEIQASYLGNEQALPSSDAYTLEVIKRATTMRLECAQSTIPVTTGTTCMVFVTNADGGGAFDPSGVVSLTSDAPAVLDRSSCWLSNGSCSFAFTPGSGGEGLHLLSATYADHPFHLGSAGATIVRVTKALTRLAARTAIVDATTLEAPLELSALLTGQRTGMQYDPMPATPVTFWVNGTRVCSTTTDAQGIARCSAPNALARALLNGGYEVMFAGDADYRPSAAHGAAMVR